MRVYAAVEIIFGRVVCRLGIKYYICIDIEGELLFEPN